MIDLILFLSLPSPLLLFLIRFLCERCLENEEDQKEFKNKVAKQLSIKLNSLVKSYEDTNESWQDFQDKLDAEKKFWTNIGDELCQTKLLAPEETEAFNNKINDIYDVNWLATAFQWLGCVLGSLVTLGGLLFWDKVRNRISHPEITRQYYRFKDGKDKLLSKITPLQEINNDDKIKLQIVSVIKQMLN